MGTNTHTAKQPRNMEVVVNVHAAHTTTSEQQAPLRHDVVILEYTNDDAHTASATPNAEEGAKRLFPSSSEISLPAESVNIEEQY